MNYIKQRKLDTFFELEEKIMSKATMDKSILEIIMDPDTGTPEDKLRLFLIFYMCSPQMSDAELKKYEKALAEAGCDLSPLVYIKRWKSYTKMVAAPNQYEGAGTKTVSMFSKLVSQGSSFVMEGVKNLVIKRHVCIILRWINCDLSIFF